MSLQRLMLRALACVALQKQADDAVSPTMADDRVFDSQLNPLVFKEFDNPMPGIIVYTDDDEGQLLNTGSGDGPYKRHVDLRIELVVGSFMEVAEDGGGYAFAMPMTDAQLEAQLDLFEAQVRWALLDLPNRPYTTAFRAFVVRITSISSHASRDESGNNKLASRRLHYKVEVNDDCRPYAHLQQPGAPEPERVAFCEKLGEFPAPWLRDMFKVMCSTPSAENVLNVLTGNRNPAAVVPLLRRIGMNIDAIAPEADPNLLAEQGKTQGPDGRIEVENILELSE